MNLAEQQKSWLMLLNSQVYPTTAVPVVMYAVTGERIPLPQMTLHNKPFPINHRVISANELVFEFDNEEFTRNAKLTEIFCEMLNEVGVPYIVGFSGNKSYHTHIFVDFRFVSFNEDIAYFFQNNKTTIHEVKKRLVTRQFGKFVKTLASEVGEIKLDAQPFNRNHPIREFGGLHEKTGFRKTMVTQFRWKPTQVIFPQKIGLWRCDEELEHAIADTVVGLKHEKQTSMADYGFSKHSE